MTKRFQFGWVVAVLIVVAALGAAGSVMARLRQPQDHPDRPPKRQQTAAQRQQTPSERPASPPSPRANANRQNANRPPAGQTQHQQERPTQRPPERRVQRQPERQPSYQSIRPPQRSENRPRGRDEDRPPASAMGPGRSNNSDNRPNENMPGSRFSPRQQVGVGSPRPFVERMRDLSPQQRDRVLQSSRAFQNLAPEQQGRIRQQFNQWDNLNAQQRADLRSKEDTWRRMRPEQRDYVKNQVLPKWRQIPWERQQVIQQKLGVLQNMPEWARKQRLSDPNFTRGMSGEDRATLHDLSHLHVGGAPDPPGTE